MSWLSKGKNSCRQYQYLEKQYYVAVIVRNVNFFPKVKNFKKRFLSMSESTELTEYFDDLGNALSRHRNNFALSMENKILVFIYLLFMEEFALKRSVKGSIMINLSHLTNFVKSFTYFISPLKFIVFKPRQKKCSYSQTFYACGILYYRICLSLYSFTSWHEQKFLPSPSFIEIYNIV